ncbi:MAG: helix-turn-helix domain-containing protein [Candidatus Uhrbacteria bacterium]
MHPTLEKEIQKLGLSEKETKVYLSSLELGPQPVQDIARKAGVNRATTYVMIENLAQRGLMSSFERGKKRLFSAEAPDRLLSLLRVQVEELREREREFSQVLPELRAILASAGERPRVRFFEGSEGVRAIREEILATEATDLWAVIEARVGANELATPEHEEYDRKMVAKGVRQHVLYTGTVAPEEIKQHQNWEFRKIPDGIVPFRGELDVFGNKIFAFTYTGKLIGLVAESEDLAETLRSVIQLAWIGAAKAQPNAL